MPLRQKMKDKSKMAALIKVGQSPTKLSSKTPASPQLAHGPSKPPPSPVVNGAGSEKRITVISAAKPPMSPTTTNGPAVTNGPSHLKEIPSPIISLRSASQNSGSKMDDLDKIVVIEPGPVLNRPTTFADVVSRPSSAMSNATAASPNDSQAGRERTKMTVGEIVHQIEAKSASLLRREDFTTADVMADLHFLTQQSRYNSDINVRRKLITKMVENGLLDIFLKVYRSVHSSDFLSHLVVEENNENEPEDAVSKSVVDLTKHDIPMMDDDTREDDDTKSIASTTGDEHRERKAFRLGKAKHVPDSMKNFKSVITLLWNVSEKSGTLCEECVRKGVIQRLIKDLTDERLSCGELKEQNKVYIVKGYIGILSNIIRFQSDSRDIYRDSGAVKVLQQYLKSNLIMIKTKTIILLSYIISESENDIINASDRHVTFMLKVLQSAVEAENHFSRKYGYWAVDICAGLNRLGAFETNKERIVQKGALPLYTKLLQPACTEEEHLLSAQGLWVLGFTEENKKLIRHEPGCITCLENLERHGVREEIKRTARWALWVILDKGGHRQHHFGASRDGCASSIGHVMVSYQWSCKPMVFKIRDRMRLAGYKVLMEADSAGSTLEVMADSVEKACVVLMCMTQKYKDSPVCRTEAEYIHRLRRDVIPIRLQCRFNPDGWLARVVGSRLLLDFGREENFDIMMTNLVRELGNRGRIRPADIPMDGRLSSASRSAILTTSQSSLVSQPPPEVAPRILTWTPDDVHKWLAENGLASLKDKLPQLSGELLLEIRKMQRYAPESFYGCLRNDLNLDFLQILKFTRALDKL